MVEDLKVAVEVKRGENGWISKENLSKAIKSVMDKDSEVAMEVKSNHVTLKKVLAGKKMQETYVDSFIKNLLDLMK
ncbi:hypothetical protein JCGZ_00022 [Jatropha curcas]|uniref:Uncharacterized protein n=1 Tax=Jatropha curcas TaxID=180498 RepID=A0A067JJL3_JATCU|nr:hypothetical protein JCGZ_00022 [Jatropha curcas]